MSENLICDAKRVPRIFRVERDQAVWERETWWVTIPDDVKVGDETDWLRDQLDLFDQGLDEGRLSEPDVHLEGALEGTDTQVRFIED